LSDLHGIFNQIRKFTGNKPEGVSNITQNYVPTPTQFIESLSNSEKKGIKEQVYDKIVILILQPKTLVTGLLLTFILYLVAKNNYLLFHSVVEGFAIMVAIVIYILATKTHRYSNNNLLYLLGTAYLFIALIDFFHTFTYKGMGVFPGNSSNISIQLWIVGRFIEAISFFLVPIFIQNKISRNVVFLFYTILTGILMLSIFWSGLFPVCYIEGQGLTQFKIISEYFIIIIFYAAIIQFYFRREKMDISVSITLILAMIFTTLSEISFTLYTDAYDTMNFVGHILKVISYYLIYRGIVLVGLEAPYNLIFQELQASAAKICRQNEQLQQEINVRKQTEEEIKLAYLELNQIFETTIDGMCVIDKNFKLIRANQPLYTLLNLTQKEVLGNKCYEVICAPLCNTLECSLSQIVNGKNRVEFDIENIWNKDTKTYCTITTTPFRKSNGELMGIVVNFRDITERKIIEQEIARLDRLNLVGEMAAGIAHEIRNPMTTVRGFLQLFGMKNEYTQYKEVFDLMIEELDRANSIITEFLSLGKNKILDLKLQNLNLLIRTVYPLIAADGMLQDKNIELKLKDIPNLILDAKEIRQVIFNLARNGLESMSNGKALTISTYLDNEEVVLEVKDQGQGIEPEILDKIGTPFFSTKENGTGLGLAVCYSIAARHSATIQIESNQTGTTFYIRFKTQNLGMKEVVNQINSRDCTIPYAI